ncbi:MAG: hypothetical protein SPL64_00300 [Bacteroidaceae bacterium]|nr:hypothetical protein [Bacteroidaceae bacterium]
MKKFILPASILFVIILAASGAYFYYYNYVQVVTDYYRVTYDPPHEKPSYFGKRYTDPKIEIGKVEYATDSIAIVKEKQWAKGRFEGYSKQLEEETAKPIPNDKTKRLEHLMEHEVLSELMQIEYTLIIISHTRDYNAEDVIKIIKDKGLNWREIEEYQRKHNVNIKFVNTTFAGVDISTIK